MSILHDNIWRRREEEFEGLNASSILLEQIRVDLQSHLPRYRQYRECSYRPCIRPTLHEELMTALDRNNNEQDLKEFIQKLNTKLMKTGASDIEWLRINNKEGAIDGNAVTFTIGQLRLVTQQPISKPSVNTSSSSSSLGQRQPALVDSWKASGFSYPDEEVEGFASIGDLILLHQVKGTVTLQIK